MNLIDQIDNLRKAVHNIDILPATPAIANKLISLNMGTEEGKQQMLLLAEQDPQIAAKIIGLANSAKAATERDITSVRDALLVLGFPKCRSIITGIVTMSLLTRKSMGHFNMHDSWLHSMGIAFAMIGIAQSMPKSMRPSDDSIFLAGMMHDIGYLALANIDPMRSDMLSEFLAAEPELPVLEIERKRLGITHDELGGELARHWNLPDVIVSAVRYHHTPDAPEARAGQPLVRLLNIAEKLLPSFGINEIVAPSISAAEWKALGINPDQADEIRKRVSEQAEQATQFASTLS